MASLLSLGFQFRGSYYSFLARVKEKGMATEYHITIMNGELEKLLYGNHILTEINGELQLDSSSHDNEQLQLKMEIALALRQYLTRDLTHF